MFILLINQEIMVTVDSGHGAAGVIIVFLAWLITGWNEP